jgi:hypothetical protein
LKIKKNKLFNNQIKILYLVINNRIHKYFKSKIQMNNINKRKKINSVLKSLKIANFMIFESLKSKLIFSLFYFILF